MAQQDEHKQKAIELALKQIDKQFGKGALVRLGDKQVEKIDSISTGSLGLDMALGIGGIPKGRIVESMDQNQAVKPPSHFKSWHNASKMAESQHLSMQNTPLMCIMQKNLA